jgi:tetratricopeptide (TPR) repeat protein
MDIHMIHPRSTTLKEHALCLEQVILHDNLYYPSLQQTLNRYARNEIQDMPEYDKTVMISYAHPMPVQNRANLGHESWTKQFVHHLQEDLSAAGFRVWLDERDSAFATDMSAQMSAAITNSKHIIVVLTETYSYKASHEGYWVGYEWKKIVEKEQGTRGTLIPILISGECAVSSEELAANSCMQASETARNTAIQEFVKNREGGADSYLVSLGRLICHLKGEASIPRNPMEYCWNEFIRNEHRLHAIYNNGHGLAKPMVEEIIKLRAAEHSSGVSTCELFQRAFTNIKEPGVERPITYYTPTNVLMGAIVGILVSYVSKESVFYSLYSWLTAKPIFYYPGTHNRNKKFAGRVKSMHKLRGEYQNRSREESVIYHNVHGISGIGKTEVVKEYLAVSRVNRSYDLMAYFEVSNLLDNFREFAKECLDIDINSLSDKSLVSKVYQKVMKFDSSLIIFDDAPGLSDIQFFMPPDPEENDGKIHIIVTSQDPTFSHSFISHEVRHYTRDDARDYILGFYKTIRRNQGINWIPEPTSEQIDQLATVLDHFPIAIAQAMENLYLFPYPIPKLVDDINRTKLELIQSFSEQSQEHKGKLSLWAAIRIFLSNTVPNENKDLKWHSDCNADSVRVLLFSAYLWRSHIPVRLIKNAYNLSQTGFTRAIKQAKERSYFVYQDYGRLAHPEDTAFDQYYKMHPLVQDVIRLELQECAGTIEPISKALVSMRWSLGDTENQGFRIEDRTTWKRGAYLTKHIHALRAYPLNAQQHRDLMYLAYSISFYERTIHNNYIAIDTLQPYIDELRPLLNKPGAINGQPLDYYLALLSHYSELLALNNDTRLKDATYLSDQLYNTTGKRYQTLVTELYNLAAGILPFMAFLPKEFKAEVITMKYLEPATRHLSYYRRYQNDSSLLVPLLHAVIAQVVLHINDPSANHLVEAQKYLDEAMNIGRPVREIDFNLIFTYVFQSVVYFYQEKNLESWGYMEKAYELYTKMYTVGSVLRNPISNFEGAEFIVNRLLPVIDPQVTSGYSRPIYRTLGLIYYVFSQRLPLTSERRQGYLKNASSWLARANYSGKPSLLAIAELAVSRYVAGNKSDSIERITDYVSKYPNDTSPIIFSYLLTNQAQNFSSPLVAERTVSASRLLRYFNNTTYTNNTACTNDTAYTQRSAASRLSLPFYLKFLLLPIISIKEMGSFLHFQINRFLFEKNESMVTIPHELPLVPTTESQGKFYPALYESDEVRIDPTPVYDAKTNAPIFTCHVYRQGHEIGWAQLYDQPHFCQMDGRHNIVDSGGVLTDTYFESLTNTIDNVCDRLPITALQKIKSATFEGARLGAIRGSANMLTRVLKKNDYSSRASVYLGEMLYYVSILAMCFTNHYSITPESISDEDKMMLALFSAITDVCMLATFSFFINILGHSGTWLSEQLQYAGHSACSKLTQSLTRAIQYLPYAYKIYQQEPSMVAVSLFSGAAAQLLVEKIGNAVSHRVIQSKSHAL